MSDAEQHEEGLRRSGALLYLCSFQKAKGSAEAVEAAGMPVTSTLHTDSTAVPGFLPPRDDVARCCVDIPPAAGTDIDLPESLPFTVCTDQVPSGSVSARPHARGGLRKVTRLPLPFVFATRRGRSWHLAIVSRRVMRVRLVIAKCSVDYAGRLTAHLPMATRLIMLKADGSILIHSDGGSYKPLNWMTPPCSIRHST